MPTVTHLDHLVLTVADIYVAAAFYKKALGMRETVFAQGRITLHFGAQKINLHQVDRDFDPKAGWPTPGSADLCFISMDPLETWILHLTGHRIPVESGPVERTGATGPIRSIYLRDPDANLIEIANRIIP